VTQEEISNEQDDLQIEDIESETKDAETTPLEYDIIVIPADYTLEVLYQKWKNKEIVMPPFQRSYVWNIVQASRLIESFLMGLPIPPVFFYVETDQKNLVIDGRQRLQSIFYFFDGFFGESDYSGKRREFKLEGINEKSRWYKKRFVDFEETDQRKLKNAVLRTILVKQLHPDQDHTSIYHIFERLNTGGIALQDQEVRNCVFSGKLNDLLVELNKYENWRKILGKPKLDTRQKDIQLILRYMSLFHNSSEYKKPMKEFLSKFMSTNRNPSNDFIQEETSRFKNTCDLLIQQLGERPFNPKGALNPSVFDSIFIAFAKNLDSRQDDMKNKVQKLRESPEFKKYTSKATTDVDVVINRLALAEKQLFG
jgi:uncharacterized protein with ParB-like and HNH nuclease domain